MSFAMIHRDVKWELEKSGWNFYDLYIFGSSCSLSEDLFICKKIREDGNQYFSSNKF